MSSLVSITNDRIAALLVYESEIEEQRKQKEIDASVLDIVESDLSAAHQHALDIRAAVALQQQFEAMRLSEEFDHTVAQELSLGRAAPSRARVEAEISALLSQDTFIGDRNAYTGGGAGGGGGLHDVNACGRGGASTESDSCAIVTCAVCYSRDVKGFVFGCDHKHCFDCTKSLLQTAAKDTSLLPPRCCGIEIDLFVARLVLTEVEADKFTQRCAEVSCVSKLYCPSCGDFINLDLLKSISSAAACEVRDTVVCMSCSHSICLKCSSLMHGGECPVPVTSTSEEALAKMADDEGWKACPRCKIYIELTHGCNHMSCGCGNHFCFKCLAPWSGSSCTNECALWDEERLFQGAEERVAALKVFRGAPIAREVRGHHLARAVRGLQANEGCMHSWQSTRGAFLRTRSCESCGYTLNVYGYVCNSDCEQTVCQTCRYHRLPLQGWR